MPPGIRRVDRLCELDEEALDAHEVGTLGRIGEREVVRASNAFEEVVGRVARSRGVRRLERKPELVDELEIGRVDGTHELAAELDRPPAVGSRHLLDATPHTRASLEHNDVGSACDEVSRGAKSGKAGTEDDDVAHGPTLVRP